MNRLFLALGLIIALGTLCAEPPALPPRYPSMTNAVADDMAKTYAFCMGQRISVEIGAEKFPELEKELRSAQQQFDNRFGDSVSAIDAILTKENTRWDRDREPILNGLRSEANSRTITVENARSFLQDVRERSTGKVPSPFLETLLIYHPEFIRAPIEEFLRGYLRVLDLHGQPKAEGLSIRLQVPQSWRIDEGNHPHIVGKATSENGRGDAIAMVLVRRLPLPENYVITKAELEDLFNEAGARDLLAPNESLRSSKPITLETLPGVMIESDFRDSRLDVEYKGRQLRFVVLFKDKLVILICMTAVPLERAGELEDLFARYVGVFRQIGNSVVIRDKWIAP